MPFDFNAPKMIWLLNFSILSVPYEGHIQTYAVGTKFDIYVLIRNSIVYVTCSYLFWDAFPKFQNSLPSMWIINYIHIVSNYEQLYFFVFLGVFLKFISEIYYCYVLKTI